MWTSAARLSWGPRQPSPPDRTPPPGGGGAGESLIPRRRFGGERDGLAETRTVLIGMGIVMMILGFVFSTLICGIGVIFLILGAVMWTRDEE